MSDFLNGLSLEMAERLYQKQVEKIESLKQELAEANKAATFYKYTGDSHWKKLTLAIEALERIAPWMSAALDDEKVCAEMKSDIRFMFDRMKQIRGENI